jgi:hypothetical protein
MTIRIVFVDDELDILQAMRRTFRGMKDEWSMEFVSSGAAALESLAKPWLVHQGTESPLESAALERQFLEGLGLGHRLPQWSAAVHASGDRKAA